MERFSRYHPPKLDTLVWLRYPADQPTVEEDRLGRIINAPTFAGRQDPDGDNGHTWGILVYANRRDRTPYTEYEEGATAYVGITVWTIRHRDDVAADAEVVTAQEKVHEIQGPPVERGGSNGGRGTRYLELHTTLRST